MTTGQVARVLGEARTLAEAADAQREVNRRRDAAVASVAGPLVAPDGRRYAKVSQLQRRVLAHLYAEHLKWEAGDLGPGGPGRTYDPAAGGLLWNPSWLLGQALEPAETAEARATRSRERAYVRDTLGRVRRAPRGPRMPTADRTAASRALLRLVDRGLVERSRSGGRGGQNTYVRLTPEGRALAELLLERAAAPAE